MVVIALLMGFCFNWFKVLLLLCVQVCMYKYAHVHICAASIWLGVKFL